jgi:hypothetical protein
MNPIQRHPNWYWNTNDAADLDFNESGSNPPLTICCYNMQDHLNRGEAREVPVASPNLLGVGSFGEPRPSGSAPIRWSGDSHRYAIYRNPSGLYKNGIVVLERHGGGMFGYTFDNLVAGETWEHIARFFTTEMIWNLCYQMAGAYRTARDAERNILYRAFLENRLKKRRHRKMLYVDLISA